MFFRLESFINGGVKIFYPFNKRLSGRFFEFGFFVRRVESGMKGR